MHVVYISVNLYISANYCLRTVAGTGRSDPVAVGGLGGRGGRWGRIGNGCPDLRFRLGLVAQGAVPGGGGRLFVPSDGGGVAQRGPALPYSPAFAA